MKGLVHLLMELDQVGATEVELNRALNELELGHRRGAYKYDVYKLTQQYLVDLKSTVKERQE